MRKAMYGALERLLGPAIRSREGCDWWQIARNDGRRRVHICLNSPSSAVAHILIFDPDPGNEEYIIDVSARTPPEVEEITARIKTVMADGHKEMPRPPRKKG